MSDHLTTQGSKSTGMTQSTGGSAVIAGIATREISGVHDLGAAASRAVGALHKRIPSGRTNQTLRVTVEVGEWQAAVDIQHRRRPDRRVHQRGAGSW